MRRSSVALACAALFLLCPPANATEMQLATGPAAQASSWRGDASISQSLRLGARFGDLVAIDLLGRLGYANVDTRLLTYVSLGGTLYGRLGRDVRPYVRLAFVHQHEEPLSAVRNDPFGAVFGVGDGIRHRGGFGTSLGADLVVARDARTQVVLGADVNGVWFPDPRGPTLYAGGGLWIGVDYSL